MRSYHWPTRTSAKLFTQQNERIMFGKIRYKLNKHEMFVAGILTALFAIVFFFALYIYQETSKEKIVVYKNLGESNNDRAGLLAKVREDKRIINAFQGQISEIGTTVGTLKKLSETDKELLKKYSKVYFLNENYIPLKLTKIDELYLFEKDRELSIHAEVEPFLKKMLGDAKEADIDILIASAFRSFGDQASLKSGYALVYGSGANQFSADQGYSEHQLGTTVDFTTAKDGAKFTVFKNSEAYKWLLENAYEYGFILSYPEDNAYYKYAPWHWRFVGTALAKTLHNEKQDFYDLDQRKIDSYLINIFD